VRLPSPLKPSEQHYSSRPVSESAKPFAR
jgi:hypothetical protein